MLSRILLTPEAPAGGGAAAAEPPVKPATEAAAPPARAAEPDANAAILAELNKLRARFDALSQTDAQRASAERQDTEKKLKDKGDYETLIRQKDGELVALNTRLSEREKRVLVTERDRAISEAIVGAGVALTPAAPGQLLSLWKREFEAAEQEDGSFKVLTKDFKTPAQVVRERLAHGDYLHFVQSAARGRGAGNGGQKPLDTRLPAQAQGNLDLLGAISARIAEQGGQGIARFERPTGFGGFVNAPAKSGK
jgi:hypothetical protein